MASRVSRSATGIALTLLLLGVASRAAAPEPDPSVLRAAIERAVPLIQKGAEGSTQKIRCFTCHNQALPLLALTLARGHGVAVDETVIRHQTEFTETSLRGGKDGYIEKRGQGGQADTAGYALLGLEAAGLQPNDITAAVAGYLIDRNKEVGHWQTSANRPPSERSPFATTYLALRALRVFGTPEQQPGIAERTTAARDWLLKTPAADTEDRVFRLWALKYAGAPAEALREAADELRQSQREDGGWSQIPDLSSDAYATGSTLLVLRQVGGLSAEDPVYRRGARFLLDSQRSDGSWQVVSRSRPFQPYFESGFPHGKDQFISMSGSCWAVAALALGLP